MSFKNTLKSLVLVVSVGLGSIGISQLCAREYSLERQRTVSKQEQEIVKRAIMPKLLKDPNKVDVVNFYTKEGYGKKRQIYGRVISEDEKNITIEEPLEHIVSANTYLKERIEKLTKSVIPEIKFYEELGDKYYAKTGDFDRDSDDWAQAFRYFERAKYISRREFGENNKKAKEIDRKLAEMNKDRTVWNREMKRRAKEKTFEFQREFGIRSRGWLGEIVEYKTRLNKLKQERVVLETSLSKMSQGKSSFMGCLSDLDKIIKSGEKKFTELWFNISKRLDEIDLSLKERKSVENLDRIMRLYLPYLNESEEVRKELSEAISGLNTANNKIKIGQSDYNRSITSIRSEVNLLEENLKRLWFNVSDELSKIEYEADKPVEEKSVGDVEKKAG